MGRFCGIEPGYGVFDGLFYGAGVEIELLGGFVVGKVRIFLQSVE